MLMTDNWLRRVMDDREISIEDMAEVLNLAEGTVRSYYYGYKNPNDKVTVNYSRG